MGDPVFQTFLLIVSLPLCFFTIVGNLFVIVGYIFHAPLRTPANAYLVSLAMADLITGLVVFPPTIHYSFVQSWMWGLPFCRIWLVFTFAMFSVTGLHLVAIAVDRYRTVTEGVSYIQRRSMRSVGEKLGLIWVIGFWVTIPVILDWGNIAVDPTAQTHCVSKKIPYWVTHFCGASFFLPSILIGRIYYQVYSEVKGKLRNKGETLVGRELTGVTESSSDGGEGRMDAGNRHAPPKAIADVTRKSHLMARERRTALTLVIISGAFIFCWLPWNALAVFDVISGIKPAPYLYTFSGIFGLGNSCINPIVYAARMPEFRTVFKKMLRMK